MMRLPDFFSTVIDGVLILFMVLYEPSVVMPRT